MSESNASVSENSTITIPIRNLVSILVAVSVSTWAYYGVIERLNKIENSLTVHWEEIEENDDWIDNFEPPREVQETVSHVRDLERQIAVLQYQVEQLSK